MTQSNLAAVAALWADVRIVVIDTETTRDPDGQQRIVAIGTVTLRNAKISSTRSQLINPQTPILASYTAIHGIDDDAVADEPPFDSIAGELTRALTPHGNETLILAGHNIPFDVSVLRGEYARLDQDIPDLATLDTKGRLPALVGVQPLSRSLQAVAAEMNVVNPKPHDALADANTAALVLLRLLDRAADQGHTDIDQLLEQLGGRRTRDTRPGVRINPRHAGARTISPRHAATHTRPLTTRAGPPRKTAWKSELAECGRLRCPYTADRVAASQISPNETLALVEEVLTDVGADGDTSGAATILGAALPLLAHLPATKGDTRKAALAWHDRWARRLAGLGRCDPTAAACPDCDAAEPCPLDTWPTTLAPVAVGRLNYRRAISYLRATGAAAGSGVYRTWVDAGRRELADEGLLIVIDYLTAAGKPETADQMIRYAARNGTTQPELVRRYVEQVAAHGKKTDLDRAVRTADKALRERNNSTAPAWDWLTTTRNRHAGRAQRLTIRLDPQGRPVRRHHPAQPRRVRPLRFARRDPKDP